MGLLDSLDGLFGPNGSVSNRVGNAMTSPLYNLGISLLGASQPFANVGANLQSGANNMLSQQGQRLQNAQSQIGTGLEAQTLNGAGLLPAPLVQKLTQMGLLPPTQGTASAPTGGLLAPPAAAAPSGQTTQSPSGPVTSYGLGSAPSTASSGAPAPASSGATPAQQAQPDPFQELQQGNALLGSPVAQYLPFLKARGQAMIDEAKARLQYDPIYITQQAAARSQLAADQSLIDNAQSAAQKQAAITKYQTDAGQLRISNNTGAVTSIGIPQPNFSTTNPEAGTLTTQNGQTLLPGATGTRAAIAAAQAQGQEAGRAPYDMEEVTDGSGNKYLVPKSQLLAPGTPGGARPAGSPAAPALAGLGPQAQAGLRGRGTQSADYVTSLQKAADDATTSNYALDNVVQSARGATLGPGAPAREFVEKGFTALAQTLDPTFTPPAELGSYQELAKYGNQLGFASARTMGSREAAQIVNMAIASNPNKELTPQAFGWIANSMKAMNNYVIAKNDAVQGADKQAPGAAQQAAATWNAKVSPQAWDLSLDPGMATQLAPKLGADKIASSMPFMASPDAVAAFRNIPASMRAAVLAKLPPQVKQELAQGLRQ